MPITVEWKHVLLDPAVFVANGTFRVARIRRRLGAFPVAAEGRWVNDVPIWTPASGSDAGLAPSTYEREGKVFVFGFWSCKEFRNGHFDNGRSHHTNRFTVSAPAPDIRVEATALYYWNFGDGPGGHGVYVDAFNETLQEFMEEDFVYVIPDESGKATRAANNGFLSTDGIDDCVVRAYSRLRITYDFNLWTNEQDLSRFGPSGLATVPTIEGTDIRIRSGSVIAAVARYGFNPSVTVPQLHLPREGGQIIGIPAGGPYIFWPFGGQPIPVPPVDPTVLTVPLSGHVAQLRSEVEQLHKRIEVLEKKG